MRKIILDCDPGHDDMIAMIIAFASKQLEVLAVTTSAGNQTQQKTNYNARKIMTFMGIEDIPVARGCEKPICRSLRIADDVHGETGLDGADLGAPGFEPSELNAVELMRDILLASNDKISIVVTGPMTNVALLLALYPQVKPKIECISFMGGSVYGGNTTPRAEFNILVDPEAAYTVFHSGVPLIMSGLEVTHKAQISYEAIERIRSIGNGLGGVTADLLSFFIQSSTPPLFAPEGHKEGAHMHDPCAVAILIDESKFVTGDFFGDIELSGQYSAGSTIIDVQNTCKQPPNIKVAFDLDNQWMTDLILNSIAQFK
ncbi:MAG: nucleoside hydrolase [Oscillospiraceae bacterium]